jgi:2,4-dienoyl-CoA reductase-like NADH-dependent reductase (Old Yellow Enzyme family)
MKKGYKRLFEPIKVGRLELKNRLAMAPMNMGFAYPNGYANDQQLAWYVARAKGGVGLIITGALLGTKLASKYPASGGCSFFYDETYLAGWANICDAVHAFGTMIFAQLAVNYGRAGRGRTADTVGTGPSPSPVPLADPDMPEILVKLISKDVIAPNDLYGIPAASMIPRQLTIEEILNEEAEYALAARRCVVAGFDGLEVHACHGYLPFQFLSPRINKRTDLYGGDLENRMRFLCELMTVTKKAVSFAKDFVVGVRLSADEHFPGGFTAEEAKIAAKRCIDLGADYVHVSSGSAEARKWFTPAEAGIMLEESKGFKSIANVPVICPNIHDPAMAEEAIEQGNADMVSLGRALIADPEWPNKVKEGRPEEIVKCRLDFHCYYRLRWGLPARCIMNPDVGRERFMPEYSAPEITIQQLLRPALRKTSE